MDVQFRLCYCKIFCCSAEETLLAIPPAAVLPPHTWALLQYRIPPDIGLSGKGRIKQQLPEPGGVLWLGWFQRNTDGERVRTAGFVLFLLPRCRHAGQAKRTACRWCFLPSLLPPLKRCRNSPEMNCCALLARNATNSARLFTWEARLTKGCIRYV